MLVAKSDKTVLSMYILCTGTEHLDGDVWEIMKPPDFFEFAVPFEMPGNTKV